MQTTRRYPRTMQEAFGPYANCHISEPYAPMRLADKIIVGAGLLIGVCVLVAIILGAI